MLDLNIKLQKNKIYTQAGNTFLKLNMLKSLLDETACFLIVVENDKNISNYLKIAENLNVKLDTMDNVSDIVNLIYNKKWNYIVLHKLINFSNISLFINF